MSRLRQSELLQTLRSNVSEAPEMEATDGVGAGRQKDKARRFAQRQSEKNKYEEANFVRLVTTRQEKKERKKLMREEMSNLGILSDIRGLAAGIDMFEGKKRRGSGREGDVVEKETERYENGKRKKKREKSRGREGKLNSLQSELYGGDTKQKKKKKRK
mmetsp:Transcript_400/g.528  ORF Transcript_400/g.528 Transcript_400/m.528 type:complete len:159 (-) Transcript_400:73-549(-)